VAKARQVRVHSLAGQADLCCWRERISCAGTSSDAPAQHPVGAGDLVPRHLDALHLIKALVHHLGGTAPDAVELQQEREAAACEPALGPDHVAMGLFWQLHLLVLHPGTCPRHAAAGMRLGLRFPGTEVGVTHQQQVPKMAKTQPCQRRASVPSMHETHAYLGVPPAGVLQAGQALQTGLRHQSQCWGPGTLIAPGGLRDH
jgi:hypothetical protein